MKTRKDYHQAVAIVRTVVEAWDPYRLIAGGAPSDEFEDEVSRLVALVPRVKSAHDAANALSRVFSAGFGDGFSLAACEDVGRDLFDALASSGMVNGSALRGDAADPAVGGPLIDNVRRIRLLSRSVPRYAGESGYSRWKPDRMESCVDANCLKGRAFPVLFLWQ